MAHTLGIGVIGMGWMGAVHSRAYGQIPDRFSDLDIATRLVVCSDDVEARAKSGANRFGFDRCVTDWKKVIEDPDVDLVTIAAPNHLHLEMAQAAAGAGKHIFCEKPVGLGPDQTVEIEHAARKAGVLTMVGYNYRWAPLVQYARQLIEQGQLGQITHYRGRFLVGYGSDPRSVLSWRFQREQAGLGTLGDLMSHAIDMAHLIAGPIQSTVANSKTFIAQRPLATPGEGTHFSVADSGPMGDVTNEDYVGALTRFENGAQGTLEACRIVNGPKCEMAFEVNGTKGALSWNFERMNELELFLPQDNPEHDGHTTIFAGPNHPFFAQFYPGPATSLSYDDLKVIEACQFAQSIVNKRQAEPGFAEALAVACVQRAMQNSWNSQSWEQVVSLRQN